MMLNDSYNSSDDRLSSYATYWGLVIAFMLFILLTKVSRSMIIYDIVLERYKT